MKSIIDKSIIGIKNSVHEICGFHSVNSKDDGTQSTIPYICRLKLNPFGIAIQ
jgi:hypothetical protein